MHARRVAETKSTPPLEDTLFVILLVALALFGEGVLGDVMLDSAGLARDPEVVERFHAWLSKLIEQHLHGAGVDASQARRVAGACDVATPSAAVSPKRPIGSRQQPRDHADPAGVGAVTTRQPKGPRRTR